MSGDTPQEMAPARKSGGLKRLAAIPTPVIFLFSVLVAVAILWYEGALSDVGTAIGDASARQVILGLALYLVGLALLAYRWHVLVVMVKGASVLPRAAEAFLTSVVINYAAPVGLAVPTRAALTKRALGLTTTETGAVAIWEVAVDVLILAIGSGIWFVVGGSALLEGCSIDLRTGAAIAGVAVAGLIGLFVAWRLVRRRPSLAQRIRLTAHTFITYPKHRPGVAAFSLFVTVVYWVMQAVTLYVLVAALGGDPSVRLALGLSTLPVLVGMLSPIPGGAGVREALMLAVARVHKADTAVILLAALTYRIALFLSIPVVYAGVRVWIAMAHTALPIPVDEPETPGQRPL